MSIRQIIFMATAVLTLAWSATEAAAKNDKKKKTKVVVSDDYYTPQPDEPQAALEPKEN